MCIRNGVDCNLCEDNNGLTSINKMNINKTKLYECDTDYFICTREYEKILCDIKNDEKLYQLIENKNLLKLPICYYEIADNLVFEENKKYISQYHNNINYLIEYLIWTYGIPNDSDNFLVKKFYTKKEILKTNINRSKINELINFIEIDEQNIINVIEGKKLESYKKQKQRNEKARKLKFQECYDKYGKVFCEVCEEDEECVLDVHHEEIQVKDMEENHVTELDDLNILCACCHRRVHGRKMTVEELKNSVV
ncbi:hypothetical protein [Clostridium sp. ZBS4]|uniref:hypothetical protein n=1 Tax=Clostridium sp. ZBS4 TaxID=2949974 RepID=UPI0020795D5C|nr:hypothetical protein [Clostridium sp. ZBS4]